MCVYVYVCVCMYVMERPGQEEMGGGVGVGGRGFLNYRDCTTKSPERRREERRRRREKALPLSAELSIAAREENKKKEGISLQVMMLVKEQKKPGFGCTS